jgi:hypothetical protein
MFIKSNTAFYSSGNQEKREKARYGADDPGER